MLEAERKLKAWMENTPFYLQLQWFDTVENVKVSSILINKTVDDRDHIEGRHVSGKTRSQTDRLI